MTRPILYSFRRCPYAMRARLAIATARIQVELREVVLRNKPAELLAVSPKGTVPVLQLPGGKVLEESLDIMQWSLQQHDPKQWCLTTEDTNNGAPITAELIADNDGWFKQALDRYKYADRYPEQSANYYRQQAETFIAKLEHQLGQQKYLVADHFSLADAAILPFIRQFAHVDLPWFNQAPYPRVQQWLGDFKASELFAQIMPKFPAWDRNDHPATSQAFP